MSGFLSKVFLNAINNKKGMRIAYKAYYLNLYLNWCKKNRTKHMFRQRDDLYQHILENEGLGGPIDYLEFGVAEGAAIRWWSENNTHAESTLTGFDTFTGLPETWKDSQVKGAFDQHGNTPRIDDARCRFEVGLFKDTLPGFLQQADFKNRKLINMDADLYSSTIFVLIHLAPLLKQGDVILFDEYRDLWHEFKALMDFTDAMHYKFKLIGVAGWLPYHYKRVALEITEIPDA